MHTQDVRLRQEMASDLLGVGSPILVLVSLVELSDG
jgi:hypothetical protein